MFTIITRKDEEGFLRDKILNNNIFKKKTCYDNIIKAIQENDLPLQIMPTEGTQILNNEQFDEIKKTMPSILRIVNKPRSFIKSIEEKVPVDVAKRINYKAISKLSMDSNDWYDRTVLTVKPKNILANTSEETINLYENYFICSLIDRLIPLLSKRRLYFSNLLEKINDKMRDMAMKEFTTNSFPFFNKISSNNNIDIDSENKKKIEEKLEDVLLVEKQIKNIKGSIFYRELHKKNKVRNPIQKTNILMFEKDYNKAYKLWKYLNETHEEENLIDEDDITQEEAYDGYNLYTFLCIIACFHDMGYKEISQNEIKLINNKIVFKELEFKINGTNSFKLKYENKLFSFKYCYSNNKYDEFTIEPNYLDFDNVNRSDILSVTTDILDKLSIIDKKRDKNITSRYSFLAIDMNSYVEKNELNDLLYKRFFGNGLNYFNQETKEHLDKWGNYKTGISIITPRNLKDNFLRIEKIINYHVLNHYNLNNLSVCPICGSKHIKKIGSGDYTCSMCHHSISITYCNHCDKEHKNPIIWVRYNDNKFLRHPDVVSDNFINLKSFEKMIQIEKIMGEKATTSFELIRENDEWELKTICPKCGNVLGIKD